MKKKTYNFTITSDNLNVLEQFHTYLISDAEQAALMYDKKGINCYYPDIKWNIKNRKDLNLFITCDFKKKYT